MDVTVVVPAYNAERFIERTLRTIITQRGVNFEVIVVNDGSTDGTEDRLVQYWIYLKTQPLSQG